MKLLDLCGCEGGGVVGADTCEDCLWPQPPDLRPLSYALFVHGQWVRVQKGLDSWVARRKDMYVDAKGQWHYKAPQAFRTPEDAAAAALRAPIAWTDENGNEVGGEGWWNGSGW